MDIRQYVWLNGEFQRADQPVIKLENRAFAYGDGFFESIHAYGTEAKHLNLHLSRIYKSIALLGMERPAFLNKDFLDREIKRLLNKNRIFGSARVRLTVFRNEGGLYAPAQNSVGFAMQAVPLSHNFYPLNTKGLVVDIFSQIRKPINILSPLKTCNGQIYVMAGLYKNHQGLDDCLIINDQNRVAEAISSNIFVVSGKKLYTPSLDEGCVAGVMRQIVIDIAPRFGFEVISNASIEPEMLLDADEMFLTNAISGINWIVGLRLKRYFGLVSRKLSEALNQDTFSQLV